YGGALTNGNASNTLVLEKTGSGTQVLSGLNTYSGGTTIREGAILVTNTAGSGLGTGAVVVEDGGTLGGTGFVTLASGNGVTIQSGGALLAGDGLAPS